MRNRRNRYHEGLGLKYRPIKSRLVSARLEQLVFSEPLEINTETNRFLERLCDRKKWPRSWWHPRGLRLKTIGDNESQKEVIEESFRTTRRTMFSLLAFCLFCLLALGAPDVQLIDAAAKIKIPFANSEIGFSSFLLVGPFLVIGIWSYLQLFVGINAHFQRSKLNGSSTPFIFNMTGFIPRLLSVLLLYWLGPFTVGVFAWKALPRPESTLLVPLTVIFILVTLWLHICRADKPYRFFKSLPSWGGILVLGFILVGPFTPFYPSKNIYQGGLDVFTENLSFINFSKGVFQRQLKLFKADLKNKDLREVNLSGAYLSEAELNNADLSGAKLSGANLNNANLIDANLSEAKLIKANLNKAKLNNAKLKGADLSGAKLNNADLSGADLSRAVLNGAKMRGADLSGAELNNAKLIGADLSAAKLNGAKLNGAKLIDALLIRADLSGANLSGANLNGAKLFDALLIRADLSRADLSGANLSGAKMSGAEGLKQTQLDEACVRKKDKPPQLPKGFNSPAKFCE